MHLAHHHTDPYATMREKCVAFWPLNETSGVRYNAVDPTTYALTDNNTVGSAAGVNGIGTAASFTVASTEYLSIARANIGALSPGSTLDFTASCWFYLPSFPATNATIMSVYNSVGNNREWVLSYQPATDNIAISFSSDGTSNASSFVTPVLSSITNDIETWYFIAIRYRQADNSGDIVRNTRYSTGIEYQRLTKTNAGIYAGTANFNIGGQSGGLTFGGRIACVGFWSRYLSNEEITLLYNNGQALNYPFRPSDPVL